VTDRLIRFTTALAVITVASVAAIISYQHAYELVCSHGESGLTARLLPFTVDGLIWAASMVVLDASRRNQRVPGLALWSLGAGIVATVGANLAHGLGHGPIGALVSAWPALALVGSFELLMLLVRTTNRSRKPMEYHVPLDAPAQLQLEDAVRALHRAGTSQRAIARELDIDRRKVKRMLDQVALRTVTPRPARTVLRCSRLDRPICHLTWRNDVFYDARGPPPSSTICIATS
jgi:hypothetical protein